MEWGDYELRISPLERAAIQAALVRHPPGAKEPFTYFRAELVAARWKAHVQVPFIAAGLAKSGLSVEVFNIRFAECLVLAAFELRHGFIASWPVFALLFHKIFGDMILPWLPSLFLAALGQQGMPRPQFDWDEVLNFHERHPVASLPKYG